VAQVPELIQPFIVLLAGAVPFIEGEGASPIGVLGGINPIAAGIAAGAGNFLAVSVVVLVSSRARSAVVSSRASRLETVAVGGSTTFTEPEKEDQAAKRESKGRQRFKKWLVRFGVPGASLLGPLAIPTHFTSAMLIAAGIPRSRVLLWQAVAITLWTTMTTTLMWIALNTVILP
jgi:hypothetical protein